jgi:hypothetical protein
MEWRRPPRWRAALAVLISLALAISLFHCCCIDGDDETMTVSVAQTSCDQIDKSAPCSTTAHCCHCLAHVTTVASQDNIVSIEYVTRLDRLAAAPAPDAVDLDSPFKPPRA